MNNGSSDSLDGLRKKSGFIVASRQIETMGPRRDIEKFLLSSVQLWSAETHPSDGHAYGFTNILLFPGFRLSTPDAAKKAGYPSNNFDPVVDVH